MRALGPKSVTDTAREASGAPAPLVCGGLRNLAGDQAAHATRGVELLVTAQPSINDDAHAFDGQARLRDGGRKYDLALTLGCGRERRILLPGGKVAKQWQYTRPIRDPGFERTLDATNLGAARQKAQDVALVVTKRRANRLRDLLLDR